MQLGERGCLYFIFLVKRKIIAKSFSSGVIKSAVTIQDRLSKAVVNPFNKLFELHLLVLIGLCILSVASLKTNLKIHKEKNQQIWLFTKTVVY